MRDSKKSIAKRMRKYSLNYLMILPGMLCILIFKYLPIFGIVIAFENYSPYSGVAGVFNSKWVGFKYFEQFFKSYYFGTLIRNTLSISLKLLILGFPLSVILALLINEVKHSILKKTIQTVTYMPHFLSAVVIAGIFRAFFSSEGMVTTLLRDLKIGDFFFLGNPRLFINTMIAVQIWQGLGWSTIIYLAAITSINPELYEAAIVDGAKKYQQTIHVTIPGIMPIIIMMLILSTGGILGGGNTDLLILLYSPSVYDTADTIGTYVFRLGIQNSKFSYTAAIGLFNSIVSVIMVLGTNWVAHKCDQPGLW